MIYINKITGNLIEVILDGSDKDGNAKGILTLRHLGKTIEYYKVRAGVSFRGITHPTLTTVVDMRKEFLNQHFEFLDNL